MLPGKKAEKQTRVSVTDALARREGLEEFVYWYFECFILQLLRVRQISVSSWAFSS